MYTQRCLNCTIVHQLAVVRRERRRCEGQACRGLSSRRLKRQHRPAQSLSFEVLVDKSLMVELVLRATRSDPKTAASTSTCSSCPAVPRSIRVVAAFREPGTSHVSRPRSIWSNSTPFHWNFQDLWKRRWQVVSTHLP
ncbi:hypothetical protein PI125_g2963 [Phytophthora idaei]|nr:hypothetical protein PI125_g2963 [Phytophthora idaei]